MSEKEQPKDETWVMQDGTRVLVGDLTEDEVKDILRMILKEQRERAEHFEQHILPQIGNIISAMSEGGFTEIEISSDPREQMDSIDEMFLKAGAAIQKTKH